MAPEKVPFMADECIMAINNVVTIDYTLKEYMQYVDQVNGVCARLNKEGGSRLQQSKLARSDRQRSRIFMRNKKIIIIFPLRVSQGLFLFRPLL
jgi:hypothetical protein